MKQILESYIDTDKTGLLLLDMPTGSGKTYAILDYIASHIDKFKENKRKVIFITTLKKNLPVLDLKKQLKRHSKEGFFASEVLQVKGQVDAFEEYFSENSPLDMTAQIEAVIPDFNTRQLKSLIQALPQAALRDVIGAQLGIKISELSSRISKGLSEEYKSSEEKLKAIQQDARWTWVPKLFPASLTKQRSVIFMTVSKFIYPYKTLVQPMTPLNELLDNFHVTLFVDEVDATKSYVQNYIIDNGLKKPIELIPTVMQIASRHRESSYPVNLTPEHILKKQPLNPEEIENNIRTESQEIVEAFDLDLNIKNSQEGAQASFIFHDKSTHYLGAADKKILTLEANYSDKSLLIRLNEKEKQIKFKDKTLSSLLARTNRFLNFFISSVYMLSNNYFYQRSQAVGISFEDAIKTYLDYYHFNEITTQKLLEEIQHRRIYKTRRLSEKKNSKIKLRTYPLTTPPTTGMNLIRKGLSRTRSLWIPSNYMKKVFLIIPF